MVDYYGIEVSEDQWVKLPKIPSRERLEAIMREKGLVFASLKTHRNIMITKKERVERGEVNPLSIDEALQMIESFNGAIVETNGFLKITTKDKAMQVIEKTKQKLTSQ